MTKFILAIVSIMPAFCLTACKHGGTAIINTTPDWVGVYTGILPCADCPGIQTVIELLQDSTYTIQTTYIDKSEEAFIQSGHFHWDNPNNVIALDNDLLTQLRAEDYALTVLFEGEDESEIPTEPYIFKKTDKKLAGKQWKLVELNGAPIEASQSPREPHIVLDLYTHRFSGSAGCNIIMGAFQLKERGKIAFSPVAATQMMCLDMELENQFIKTFDLVNGYTIDGDTLIFIDDVGTPLARFTTDSSR